MSNINISKLHVGSQIKVKFIDPKDEEVISNGICFRLDDFEENESSKTYCGVFFENRCWNEYTFESDQIIEIGKVIDPDEFRGILLDM